MIEILPLPSISEQKAFCARCGIKHLPDQLAYSAMADGEVLGICLFSIKEGVGHVAEIASCGGDYQTLFLLGRAVLNFFELRGVKKSYFDGSIRDEKLIFAIGFSKNSDGRYLVDLTDFSRENE